ncbi:hypothetical protein LUZ60_004483 [Juncus effusus]|nr:hypothetical protein LUZ60_004483 [Juncus effusus]
MAAGRYRDYNPKDRDFDPEPSRRNDYQNRHRRDLIGDSNNNNNNNNKFRDSNRRNSTNGFHHNTNNYPKYPPRNRSPMVERKRVLDREPGELSSSSESEKSNLKRGNSRENRQNSRENRENSKENGLNPVINKESKETGDSSPSKKRKFSPIVWDLDNSKQSVNKSPQKTENEVTGKEKTPPLPPLPPQAEPIMDLEREELVISPRDLCVNGDNEPGQIQEEYDELYPTARTISSSRWAEKDEELERETVLPKTKKSASPLERETSKKVSTPTARTISSSRWAENDKELERETVLPKKKKSVSPLERETTKTVSTPEPGEVLVRETSVRTVSRSSGSDREEREDDYMEVERENGSSYSDSESDFSKEETPQPENKRSINMLLGCRSVDSFERLNKINEGTYGVVYRARDKKTGEIVALKKIKMEREREGFPLTSLREINILLSFHQNSIVDVKEVVVGSSLDSIFMVMEYMEHDLKGVMETMKQPYSQSEVKCLMLQLLEGVKYLHDNWVLHRDLKTSNLLLNNSGELKICDFGLSRQYGSPLKAYTQLVVTLWYRAPELLLGGKEYSTAIDMWSVGCIMAELLAKEPLFSGKSEFDQLDKIFRILGTPSEKIWPGFKNLPGTKVNFVKQPYNKLREKFPRTSFSGRPTLSEAGFDLLNRLLTYDPEKRITAEEALKHPWFIEVPLPKSKDFMPTFPSLNEKDRRVRRSNLKSPDPIEELRRKEMQGEIGSRGLFG